MGIHTMDTLNLGYTNSGQRQTGLVARGNTRTPTGATLPRGLCSDVIPPARSCTSLEVNLTALTIDVG